MTLFPEAWEWGIARFRRKKLPTVEPPPPPLEWVCVTGWFGRNPGWIPRFVLEEEFAIDCSPLDRRMWDGKQGTVWFTAEQSEAIRKHKWFEPEAIAETKR
jgi:hypothetical protein